MEDPARKMVWLQGPHFQGNGIFLSPTRLLTSKQVVFTYHDATLSSAVTISKDVLASAPCLPSRCLLINQTLDFCIVAISDSFCKLAGIDTVELAEEGAASEGDELEILTWAGKGHFEDGGHVLCRGRVEVDHVTESELFVHALQANCHCDLGSPLVKGGRVVGMVVKADHPDGLRALRIGAIMQRLEKRGQLDLAMGRKDTEASVPGNSRGGSQAEQGSATVRRLRWAPRLRRNGLTSWEALQGAAGVIAVGLALAFVGKRLRLA